MRSRYKSNLRIAFYLGFLEFHNFTTFFQRLILHMKMTSVWVIGILILILVFSSLLILQEIVLELYKMNIFL